MSRLIAPLVLVVASACDGPPPAEPSAVLIADTEGAIARVLTVVTSPSRSALRNQALIETLTRDLGPQTHLLILADPEMIVEPNPWPQRMTFVPIPAGLRFTIWPQDPFVVLDHPDQGPRLLAARGYGRADDREMARVVAEHLGWPVVPSSLFFAGGNILADERHAFIGASLVAENAEELERSDEEIVRRFASELGRPPIVIEQVLEHIDMAITPLGAGRIAVADAEAGAVLAERALEESPEIVGEFERSAERNFFGDPTLERVTDPEGREVRPPAVVGATRQAVAGSREISAALDRIATDLAGRGYEVLRVPFLGASGTDPTFASYPVLSYNNVLIERVDGVDRVYLARYGLAALDDEAARVWTNAGFEVHPIAGVTTSAMYRGSIRCTVKVLDRTASTPG